MDGSDFEINSISKFLDEEVSQPTRQQKLDNWGPGEWVDEPNSQEFVYFGYKCLCRRVCVQVSEKGGELLGLGHWCGYVVLPNGHALSNKNFAELSFLEVHGGITFSEELKDGNWMIGFDCAHSSDEVPGSEFKRKWGRTPTYKNLNFVMEQIQKLVRQVARSNGDLSQEGYEV